MTDSSIKKSEVRRIIEDTLGVKHAEQLDEAYVAQPKSYDIPTELLSEKAKAMHARLYENYVQALNAISANLDAIDRQTAHSNVSPYRSLKIDECYNLNAVWLHELFFANMSDVHSEIMSDSLSYMRLERDFGTFDDWQFDFVACAGSARSGWAACGFNMFLQRYVNMFIDGHDVHVPMGFYPVIVIDVWEHAFVKDYIDSKHDYIIGQMKELRWDLIEQRFEKADQIAKVLSGGVHAHGV